ncbi:MAG: YggT family protein [Candidatus Omnitrophica bacterium]|nr:YggT family protein [Candidatus Omnitrophota bacterium]
MFIIVYTLQGLALALELGLNLFYWLIIARALLSWFINDPFNPLMLFLRRFTDPVLEPFSKVLMPLTLQIQVDLSPLIAIFTISFAKHILVRIAYLLR